MPTPKCFLCDAENSEVLQTTPCSNHPLWNSARPLALEWHYCHSCHHVFQAVPTLECLPTTPGLPHELPGSQNFGQEHTYLLPLAMANANRGRALDFGCGAGSAGICAQLMGFTVEFYDIREEVQKGLQALGLKLSDGNFPEDTYELVIACDVIEHIRHPQGWLQAIWKTLKPGGTLFLSTPNRGHPAWNSLPDNPYYMEVEHFHIFNTSRLCRLLDQCDFSLDQAFPNNRYLFGMDYIARKN